MSLYTLSHTSHTCIYLGVGDAECPVNKAVHLFLPQQVHIVLTKLLVTTSTAGPVLVAHLLGINKVV